MNGVNLKTVVLVSSIISIMSFEELVSSGCFNGPVFDPNSISLNVDSDYTNCDCCKGCTK